VRMNSRSSTSNRITTAQSSDSPQRLYQASKFSGNGRETELRIAASNDGLLLRGGSRNLTQSLVDKLSQSIRNSAIKPGEKLPSEATIRERYGVSRTVVREAITSLQAAGLIETRHGIGSFVRPIPTYFDLQIDEAAILTVREVLAMLELRISVETEAAAFAAARRTENQLEEMQRALDLLRTNMNSGGNAAEADFQFHLQIANATGNPCFVEIMSHLGTQSIPRARLNAHQTPEERLQYLNLVNKEHVRIFDAIVQRDPEEARAAMRTHLASSRERLRRAQDLASHKESQSSDR
jgi:GntR family transcriptional regulator, transcriptional repressor for pyruvate dehydrogenase complex